MKILTLKLGIQLHVYKIMYTYLLVEAIDFKLRIYIYVTSDIHI